LFRLYEKGGGQLHASLFTSVGRVQKQLENVEYFNYLGRKITSNARCVSEIRSRIAKAIAAFYKKKILFSSNLEFI
jgi:hypothetical protein